MSKFKSEAQRTKFEEMVKAGTMKQSVLDQWNHQTEDAKLPERVEKKPVEKKKRWKNGIYQ